MSGSGRTGSGAGTDVARTSPATACVHGLRSREPRAPLVPPIVRSTAFLLDDETYDLRRAGKADRSRAYARETSPTVEAVEGHLALLEGAERALLFASGLAALHGLLLGTIERGDRVVCVRQVYGGSRDLLSALLPRLDVELAYVDVDDLDGLRALSDERLRLVFCESVSNPLTAVADLPAIAAVLRAAAPRALLAVDATVAGPVAQRPLALGADVVMHSATKMLGGHTDLVGGVLAGPDELLHAIWRWRTRAGGCLDPEPAFLVERGLKTLALRTRAHAAGARRVAEFLVGHERVERVHYCGLPGDPWHGRAAALLDHTGGLLSFVLRDGGDAARAVLRRLSIFLEAPSLGGVESLATRPVDMSHVYLTPEDQRAAGVVPGMLRLSVGIEEPEDLVADLARALEGTHA